MNKDKEFNWVQRLIVCQTQVELEERAPSNSITDGMPIGEYWKQQMEIAERNCTSFDKILDELAELHQQGDTTVEQAHEAIKEKYGDAIYLKFERWMNDVALDIK